MTNLIDITDLSDAQLDNLFFGDDDRTENCGTLHTDFHSCADHGGVDQCPIHGTAANTNRAA